MDVFQTARFYKGPKLVDLDPIEAMEFQSKLSRAKKLINDGAQRSKNYRHKILKQ